MRLTERTGLQGTVTYPTSGTLGECYDKWDTEWGIPSLPGKALETGP